jgi:hypothetical protein
MWGGFDVRTTPEQIPNVKRGEVMFASTQCPPELPCGGATITSGENSYYVLAVQNSNAVSMKIQVDVPWDISCKTATK